MYILLADDTEDGFHTDSDWEPLLHEYQQVAAVQYVQYGNDCHHGRPVFWESDDKYLHAAVGK